MAKKTINLGAGEIAGDGESIRSAFSKINDNFDELYAKDATDFDGDYNSLTNKPTIPTDIGDLTDTGNLLSSGGADTGDITFNGVKIQGAGTASGDGNGYATLELVPDTNLYANDQYLIIDPTAPSHIHIRAGGTQDASNAELYLGGEKNNVRVIDDSGVRLYNETRNDTFNYFSDPTGFNTATWYGTPGNYFVQFTQVTAGMGDLAFQFGNDDQNRVTVSYGAGENSTLTYGGSTSNLGGGVYRFAVVEAPPASPTVLTAIEFQIWTTNNNRIELQNNDFTVSVEDDIRITGNDIFSLRNRSTNENIEIHTDFDNSDYTWAFGFDGTLSTPGDIVVNGDVTGTAGGSTLVLRAEPGSNTVLQLNDIVDSEIRTVANLVIRTDVTSTPHVWTFGTDGSLTFPDSTAQTTAFTGTANLATVARNIHSEDAVEIKVNLTDSTTHTWRFGEDGHLNLPSGGGNIQSDGTIQLITGSSTVSVTDDVFGFSNTKNGIIALSLISGGVSIAASGNFAFSGDNFFATTTNNINFTSGNGITLNSPVTEVRGNNLTLVGDNVDIKSEGNVNIDINLSDSTLRRWQFGEDGDLTLPNGGGINGAVSEIFVDTVGSRVITNRVGFDDGIPGVQIATSGGIYNQISLVCNGNNSGDGIFDRRTIELSATGGFVGVTGILRIEDGVQEKFQTKADATGVVEHNLQSGQIIYHTSPDADWTVNLTNLDLKTGYATAVTLIIVQGGTGYYPSALQIGGAAQTINWQGNATPTPSTNRTDVVTFSIINNSGTYTVLGQLTGF